MGRWVNWTQAIRIELELFASGRFEGVAYNEECQNKVLERSKGTWEVVEDAIHWRYTEAERFPCPKKVQVNLIEHLDPQTFTVWENKRWKTSWFRLVEGEELRLLECEETSANFDSDQVQPFLERIAQSIDSGFGATEIAAVVKRLRRLKLNQTGHAGFLITHKGTRCPFRICIFMDDVDAPDIDFYAPVELTRRIEDELKNLRSWMDG